MDSTEEWARGLKQQIDAHKRGIEREEKRAAARRDIAAEKTPLVWEKLLEEFDKCCEAVNRLVQLQWALEFRKTEKNDFTVRPPEHTRNGSSQGFYGRLQAQSGLLRGAEASKRASN